MTIIDKNKRSPYFVYTPTPTFRSQYEEQKWFDIEKGRWVDGYGEMPGALYFYLSQGFLKHRVIPNGHESIERPTPLISCLWRYQFYEQCRKNKKIGGVFKARNTALSTEGGALCQYFAKVYPGSTSLITSKDQDGISVFFREKVYAPFKHLDDRIRPDILKENDTKARCYLRLGVSHLDKNGSPSYSVSNIDLRETSQTPKSPTNFSGQGAQFGFFDELPLHPRKTELLNSAIECFRDFSTKEINGFLLFGGTFEETMSNEDVDNFKNLLEDKSMWDCEILFVPFWWNMMVDEAGYPDEKKANEWWDKEIEKLKGNLKKEKAFRRNNPRTLEDIFETASGGRWEEDVEVLIQKQKEHINNADVSCPKYVIVKSNDKIEAILGNKGVSILEHPCPSCTYGLMIDAPATDEVSGGLDGSNVAGVVIKLSDPKGDPYMPVAILNEHPVSLDGAYLKLIHLGLYYNKFGGFDKFYAEANAATAAHLYNILVAHDLKHWVSYRKDLSGKGWVNTSKAFTYRSDDNKEFQYKQGNTFLREYIHSIQMMELIVQMLWPKKKKNADILDAWLQLFNARPDIMSKPKPKPPPVQKKIVTIKMVNGYSQRVNIPMP